MIIESRIGKQDVDESKIIFFPKGIIGFEGMRRFTLLQIKEDSPFLLLQSLDDAVLGLLVADPFSFLPDYSIKIGDAEQSLLQANSAQELAVLVTASIPPGEPEKTTLNLLGPILINHESKIGLQIPQTDLQQHSHVKVHVAESEAE